jgi:hypothetical protein
MSLDLLTTLFRNHPAAVIAFFGLFVPFAIFLLTRPDRRLQRRRIYLDLEFEASRIFRLCIDHPEIVVYIETKSNAATPEVREKTYWYVCQVLNAFELMISFRNERMVANDLFATWVSWFHELGTAAGFDEFWRSERLMFHYKSDLQKIMAVARELSHRRPAHFDQDDSLYDQELLEFHQRVSEILKDDSIRRHFITSLQQNGRAA